MILLEVSLDYSGFSNGATLYTALLTVKHFKLLSFEVVPPQSLDRELSDNFYSAINAQYTQWTIQTVQRFRTSKVDV